MLSVNSSIPLINLDNEDALVYEERLINTPYDVLLWLEYIDSVDTSIYSLRQQASSKKAGADVFESVSTKVSDSWC